MTRVHLSRLLKLAAFLEKVPRRRFDYTRWATGPLNECGTVGCALGWATTIPAFRRLGLRLKKDYVGTHYVGLKGTGSAEYSAARQIFGLGHYDAEYLFIPGRLAPSGANPLGLEATPKQVARHIRKFVQSKKKESATE